MADQDPEPADVDDAENEDDVDELERDHGIEGDDPEADDLDEL